MNEIKVPDVHVNRFCAKVTIQVRLFKTTSIIFTQIDKVYTFRITPFALTGAFLSKSNY